ncbi:MAG TPA: SDR family oxidoreductase [Acidimicrobiales bacterium]|nr:SDR family oxidoreductase [Acidimicrobiales bacterium]
MTEGTVIVTGASNGIGRAVADRFHADGRTVVGIDRVDPGESTPYPIEQFDLSETKAVGELCQRLERDHGPLSALVNVAGIYEAIDPAAFSLDAYRRMLAVDLDAPIILSVTAANFMAKRGFGRIVNVTSIRGDFAERGGLAYDTAKAGLNQATRTLALEFSGRGVLCNAVAPGFVETAMSIVDGVLETTTDEFRRFYVDGGRIPTGRAAQPHELGGLIAWLASSDNTYVTGQVIRIDGGLSASF